MIYWFFFYLVGFWRIFLPIKMYFEIENKFSWCVGWKIKDLDLYDQNYSLALPPDILRSKYAQPHQLPHILQSMMQSK